MKTAIIGGGAAGLAYAVEASRRGEKIWLYERQDRVGKKLSMTGGGRCNILNAELQPAKYNNPNFVSRLYEKITFEKLKKFFSQIGLFLSPPDSEGRIFPVAEYAPSVVDCLRFAAVRNGVEACFEQVERVEKQNGVFRLFLKKGGEKVFDKVVVACGSAAQAANPALERYVDSKYLMPFVPSLTPLKVKTPFKGASGVRTKGVVRLYADGVQVAEEKGEIQFRDYGLSGIAVFNLSACLARDKVKGVEREYVVEADFVPYLSVEELTAELKNRMSHGIKQDVFCGILQNKLAAQILQKGTTAEALALAAKGYSFFGAELSGFDLSQVCCGGVKTEFLDGKFALPDKTVVVGEAVDVDGLCGGYNLSFAFASALAAAGVE